MPVVIVGLSTLSMLASCGQTPTSPGTGPSGGKTVSSASGTLDLSFAEHPELKTIGGSAHISQNQLDIYVTRVSENAVQSVSTICTHQGCTINAYDPGSHQYVCPCHGSVFNADGSVANGPASSPLQNFACTLTSTGVSVTVS